MSDENQFIENVKNNPLLGEFVAADLKKLQHENEPQNPGGNAGDVEEIEMPTHPPTPAAASAAAEAAHADAAALEANFKAADDAYAKAHEAALDAREAEAKAEDDPNAAPAAVAEAHDVAARADAALESTSAIYHALDHAAADAKDAAARADLGETATQQMEDMTDDLMDRYDIPRVRAEDVEKVEPEADDPVELHPDIDAWKDHPLFEETVKGLIEQNEHGFWWETNEEEAQEEHQGINTQEQSTSETAPEQSMSSTED